MVELALHFVGEVLILLSNWYNQGVSLFQNCTSRLTQAHTLLQVKDGK